MRKTFLYSLSVMAGFLIFSATSFAQTRVLNGEVQSISWQCESADIAGETFYGRDSFTKSTAKNSALKACSDHSRNPESCKISECHGEFVCRNHACDF